MSDRHLVTNELGHYRLKKESSLSLFDFISFVVSKKEKGILGVLKSLSSCLAKCMQTVLGTKWSCNWRTSSPRHLNPLRFQTPIDWVATPYRTVLTKLANILITHFSINKNVIFNIKFINVRFLPKLTQQTQHAKD